MKTLVKVVAVLFVVVLLVVVFAILNLDKGIKAAVENIGPKLTQSSVTLDDVELSLTSGEGSLRGLVVGNPSGFKSPSAFSLGEIFLSVDPESVTTDTIVLNSIRIVAPAITYESANGTTNLAQLQKNVEQAAGGSSRAATEEKGEGAEKKLIIRDLQITAGKLSYSNPLLGDKTVALALPDIRLTGIGEKSNGASAAEVVNQVLAAINKSAAGAVANAGVLKDAGDQIKQQVEGKLGGFKSLLKKDE